MTRTDRNRADSIAVLAVLCALAAGAVGCASTTQVYVKSTDQTNQGNTLYMMARGVDAKTVAAERYQEVAAKLFASPKDPSILSSQPVFPGNTITMVLDNEDQKDVVLYFFFTNPGSNWRVPLRRPLPAEVYIELGQNQVERVQVKKR